MLALLGEPYPTSPARRDRWLHFRSLEASPSTSSLGFVLLEISDVTSSPTARFGSSPKWAYRFVVEDREWPSCLPTTKIGAPAATAAEAKPCRRSCIRHDPTPARSRTGFHCTPKFTNGRSVFMLGKIHRQPANRGSAIMRSSAGAGRKMTFGPVLLSGSVRHRRSMSSHCHWASKISLRRAPVMAITVTPAAKNGLSFPSRLSSSTAVKIEAKSFVVG